jgi:putative CocE/NonD family hydrolase
VTVFIQRWLVIALLAAPSLAVAQAAQEFEPVLQENVMIPARDGVKLATDIYRPGRNGQAAEGRFPVILQRTPYNKSSQGRGDAVKRFVGAGYVVAIQDTRGRYKSEGVFDKYAAFEVEDGYDAIEWLAKQPYSTGKTGMWGTSIGAHTQAAAARANPPHLSLIVPNFGGMRDGWDHKIRNHGAFELTAQIGWAFAQIVTESEDSLVRAHVRAESAKNWTDAIPLRKGLSPLAVSAEYEKYFYDMATQGDYDSWKHKGTNWKEYFAETSDIPMLHVGGWYDTYAGGTVENYADLSRMKKSPIRLLMGPWTHGGNTRSFAGDVEFGPQSAIANFGTDFHIRLFDHYLKGVKNGVENEPSAKFFVMGTGDGHKDSNNRLFHGGYWRESTGWPVPGTRFVQYYFHADGSLSTQPPAGSAAPSTTYTFDPHDPVPTIGGSFTPYAQLGVGSGAYNQREDERVHAAKLPFLPLKARADIVVFQTEPLQEDIEVIGPIVVKLNASSSALDTDFTAKLVDVYPPSNDYPSGFEMNVTDGIIRARYRSSPSRAELMKPGAVYQIEIQPFPTANVFKKGHRIRVDISSSNYPHFDVNPNTGEPLGQHRAMVSADNTIYHSAQYPSHIVIPIAPKAR